MKSTLFYGLVVLVSFVLSGGGILYAARPGHTAAGGLGGAVAVAVSFAVLFGREDYSTKVYRRLVKDQTRLAEIENSRNVPAISIEQLAPQVAILNGVIDDMLKTAKEQRIQTIALGVASCVGTLAWGFGDKLACVLLEYGISWPY